MRNPDRPTVPEVLPLAHAYYRFEHCGAGGSLHIVLDDGNVEDSSISYCIEYASDPASFPAREYGGHDKAGELLGRLLLLMSWTQRSKIYRLCTAHGELIDHAEFILRCRTLLDKYSPSPSPGQELT